MYPLQSVFNMTEKNLTKGLEITISLFCPLDPAEGQGFIFAEPFFNNAA